LLTRPERTFEQALKDLQVSFEKSYDLYLYLIKLIPDLTYLEERRLDDAKHKFLPTEEDLNPNTRFIDNKLVEELRKCEPLQDYINEHNLTWRDDEIFLRLMLDKVLNSRLYQDYMDMAENDFALDCELWHQMLRRVILVDDDMLEFVESKSIYWGIDDLNIIGQFVMKTIRRFEDGVEQPILPMFKDEEDEEYCENLFMNAIKQFDENKELIDSFVKQDNWDVERIAMMDRIIMCVALTEIKSFPSIPVNVSLNEYIEMAKNFSTARSGQFVNGILHSAVRHLKSEGLLMK
ncbi:MAG: transcription antitermination protein NusB, partial [Muribaculaceae bacterium]|nr:transcription antitermination protein NusB [Muribaculaceae bacterium]